VSADTIVVGYADPQNLNRYSYVINNPVRFIDPTGHMVACDPYEDDCHHDYPTASSGGGNGGPGGHDDDDFDPNPDGLPAPTLPPSTQTPSPTPAPEGVNNYDCFTRPYACGTVTPPQTIQTTENTGSPLISIVGLVLTVQLGILDIVLGYGIVTVAVTAVTVPGAQLGLAGELVLLPLEVVSLNLTIFAAQMASSGTTDHDPLLLIHGFYPDFLPYDP
jgi:hypothetical protein